MNKKLIALCAGAGLVFSAVTLAKLKATFVPGYRVQVLAHNAYPDHGKYTDRLDRAIAAGVPFAVEEDLAWTDGRSLMIHGAKNVGGDDPTLENYFFPKVTPIMEQALKDGNKGNWPLITLYLDIKNDPPEHLAAISKVLDEHQAWLTTAAKGADITKQAPLDMKPMMVLVEDKANDIKQDFFYDRLPVGGKIRVFGTATKLDENPQHLPRERKQEAIDYMSTRDPEQLLTKKADNYRRWIGVNWAFIEKGGQTRAGEWSSTKEERLKKFTDYGHRLGYLVSFYCLNGYTQDANQGWDKDYNFGSRDAAVIRWKAAIRARVDFISTDHYAELASVIREAR